MRTIKLVIQYEGSQFSGWQIQPSKRTVQGVIQDTLRKILCENIDLLGASRTDAGVHALGQVAHFKTKNKITLTKLHQALKRVMPPDIAIVNVFLEKNDFHAQRHAKKKTYRYWIWNGTIGHPHLHGMSWNVPTPLNIPAMKKASKHLIGEHDFYSFRASDAQTKTSVRTIYKIAFKDGNKWVTSFWKKAQGNLFCIEFTGNGFLKNMIRNIMGSLVDVGRGRETPGSFKKILESCDRKRAGMKVPPQGLFLVTINY